MIQAPGTSYDFLCIPRTSWDLLGAPRTSWDQSFIAKSSVKIKKILRKPRKSPYKEFLVPPWWAVIAASLPVAWASFPQVALLTGDRLGALPSDPSPRLPSERRAPRPPPAPRVLGFPTVSYDFTMILQRFYEDSTKKLGSLRGPRRS